MSSVMDMPRSYARRRVVTVRFSALLRSCTPADRAARERSARTLERGVLACDADELPTLAAERVPAGLLCGALAATLQEPVFKVERLRGDRCARVTDRRCCERLVPRAAEGSA